MQEIERRRTGQVLVLAVPDLAAALRDGLSSQPATDSGNVRSAAPRGQQDSLWHFTPLSLPVA
ncbi:MAG: hypothetical protein LZF62_180112 [Nitrospira sp.]|nr:MAG: hypothetical protein LZF62_180112 [Nitrospira sp.]